MTRSPAASPTWCSPTTAAPRASGAPPGGRATWRSATAATPGPRRCAVWGSAPDPGGRGRRRGSAPTVRTGWTRLRLLDADGAPLAWERVFGDPAIGEVAERAVSVDYSGRGGRSRGGAVFPARLVVLRLAPAAAAARAAKAQRRKQQNRCRSHRPLQPLTVRATGYLRLVTSLPAEAPAAQVLAAYRLRRQVELAFKRLKSLLGLDRLPARSAALARSWLFAHLIAALLIEDTAGKLLDLPPWADADAATPHLPLARHTDAARRAPRRRAWRVERRGLARRRRHPGPPHPGATSPAPNAPVRQGAMSRAPLKLAPMRHCPGRRRLACCRHGPASPAASARIQPVLRRSGPSSPSRNRPADAATRSWVNKGRIRAFTPRSDDAHSSSLVSIDAPLTSSPLGKGKQRLRSGKLQL